MERVGVGALGELISYEEYQPYGACAYRAQRSGEVSGKRYRFTGMEKDEETGLSYHHHRYLAVWLGRWVSSDPIGLGGGINRWAYCSGSPARGFDRAGTADESDPRPVADQLATVARSKAPTPVQRFEVAGRTGAYELLGDTPLGFAARGDYAGMAFDWSLTATGQENSPLGFAARGDPWGALGAMAAQTPPGVVLGTGKAFLNAITSPVQAPANWMDIFSGDPDQAAAGWKRQAELASDAVAVGQLLLDLGMKQPRSSATKPQRSALIRRWLRMAEELRARVGGKFAKGEGNVGLAEGIVDGVAFDLKAVSGEATPPGTVGNPSNRTFSTKPSGAQTRDFDTEVLMLEDIAARPGISRESKGVVLLFTEKPPCTSCGGVIEQFRSRFPDITLIVFDKEGNAY